jgi:tRNA dimethylallyltransferase
MEDVGIKNRPLVVIVGPTAVGKTALSVELAKRLNGEIVSADSMQVYRYMDIGTAKPTLDERGGIPHHMMDILEPGEPFNVAQYQRMADEAMEGIYQRGRLPILVGGTGLYIKTVVDGFLFPDSGRDPEFRRAMEEKAFKFGNECLYDELRKVDPEAAQKIHLNDLRRIIRALEVFHTTGRPISEQQKGWDAHEPRYQAIFFGLTMDRAALYERIEARVDGMMEAGLLHEVTCLFEREYSERITSMQALGYKEIIGYLKGEYSLERAVEILKRDTRRYAKRQLTWFKRDKRILWMRVDEYREKEQLLEDMVERIEGCLNSIDK